MVDSLQPALLGMFLKLVQDGHTFVLSAICSDHHNDGMADHAGGRKRLTSTISTGCSWVPMTMPWTDSQSYHAARKP